MPFFTLLTLHSFDSVLNVKIIIMKKKNLKGLKLNKKNISSVGQEKVTGGFTAGRCTIGCTDGCTPIQTAWNCSRGNCTGNCDGGISLFVGCPIDNED